MLSMPNQSTRTTLKLVYSTEYLTCMCPVISCVFSGWNPNGGARRGEYRMMDWEDVAAAEVSGSLLFSGQEQIMEDEVNTSFLKITSAFTSFTSPVARLATSTSTC